MMEKCIITVSEKGQKIPGTNLTVKSFISDDGIDYDTLKECKIKNLGKHISVRNNEYGGVTPLEP